MLPRCQGPTSAAAGSSGSHGPRAAELHRLPAALTLTVLQFLTPVLRRPRWPGLKLCPHSLLLPPALTQKACPAPGGPRHSSHVLFSTPPSTQSQVFSSSSPPREGCRLIYYTHQATRGGTRWSQCEVQSPPPFSGMPAWSSANPGRPGTGLGSKGRGLTALCRAQERGQLN